jgi:adenylosuccinate synthase
VDGRKLLEELTWRLPPRILPFRDTVWHLLDKKRARGSASCSKARRASLLDIDFGTYPFVTSSNTIAGRRPAAPASGRDAGLRAGHHQGLHHAGRRGSVSDRAVRRDRPTLGERGHEFGTVTGRKRRCGWFDAALVRQAVDVRHHRHRADQARRAGRA